MNSLKEAKEIKRGKLNLLILGSAKPQLELSAISAKPIEINTAKLCDRRRNKITKIINKDSAKAKFLKFQVSNLPSIEIEQSINGVDFYKFARSNLGCVIKEISSSKTLMAHSFLSSRSYGF